MKGGWSPLLALCWAGAAAAAELSAGGTPVRLDVTSTTLAAWNGDNRNVTACDDGYGSVHERLNISGAYEQWVAGLRLDASAYYPRPLGSPPGTTGVRCREIELRSRYLNTLSAPGVQGGPLPEKLWAGYQGRSWEVVAGDSYVSFGRGLVLSLRKNDELGTDNTQRGVRARYSGERLNATVVGGFTNINNIDEASGRFAPDPHDGVLGATADLAVLEGLRLGGSATTVLFQEAFSTFSLEDQRYQERWLLAGPRLEAPRLTDWLGVYLEGVAQRRMHADGAFETGYGLYGTATAHFGPATVLLEGKAYGDLAVVQPRFEGIEFQPVQYTSLPTLERVQQQLEHPQRNIIGGRVRVDWSLRPGVVAYANYGGFRDFEGYLEPDVLSTLPGTIHDPYLGMDARYGPHRLTAHAGSRFVVVRGRSLRTDGHIDLNLLTGLGGGASIEAHVLHLERGKRAPLEDAKPWREGTLQLGYRQRPHFAVSAIVDYSTEKAQPKVWYPGGSAEWQISEASSLRLFAGSSRGGLRCVSGVCRNLPPFSGMKGMLTLRY